MVKFCTCLLAFLFLCLPLAAQPIPADLAADTEKLIDSLYKVAGPEFGCLLYEPSIVMTLAGLHAEGSSRPEVMPVLDQAKLDQLNGLLAPRSARLQAANRDVTVASLNGLKRVTEASKLLWVVKFDPALGWDGYDEWIERTRKSLEAGGSSEPYSVVRAFVRAAPDLALTGQERSVKSRLDQERMIRSNLAYSDQLEGDSINFTILPEDAGAAEVTESLRSRSAFLKAFYTSTAVRGRFLEPSFQAARVAANPKFIMSDGEQWLRDKEMLSAFYGSSKCQVSLESVLISYQNELVALVRSGAGPDEWERSMLEWTSKDGVAQHVDKTDMESWLWLGAYPGSSARANLYSAVRETRPNLYRAIAEKRVGYWLKGAANEKNPRPESAFVLFSHPEVKAYYATLEPSGKEEIMEVLEGMSFDVGIRELTATAPYAR